jgi:hypothetical protein
MPRTFEQIAYDAAYATGTMKDDILNPDKRGYDVSLGNYILESRSGE